MARDTDVGSGAIVQGLRVAIPASFVSAAVQIAVALVVCASLT